MTLKGSYQHPPSKCPVPSPLLRSRRLPHGPSPSSPVPPPKSRFSPLNPATLPLFFFLFLLILAPLTPHLVSWINLTTRPKSFSVSHSNFPTKFQGRGLGNTALPFGGSHSRWELWTPAWWASVSPPPCETWGRWVCLEAAFSKDQILLPSQQSCDSINQTLSFPCINPIILSHISVSARVTESHTVSIPPTMPPLLVWEINSHGFMSWKLFHQFPQTGRGCFPGFPLSMTHPHGPTSIPKHCNSLASCLPLAGDTSPLEPSSSL